MLPNDCFCKLEDAYETLQGAFKPLQDGVKRFKAGKIFISYRIVVNQFISYRLYQFISSSIHHPITSTRHHPPSQLFSLFRSPSTIASHLQQPSNSFHFISAHLISFYLSSLINSSRLINSSPHQFIILSHRRRFISLSRHLIMSPPSSSLSSHILNSLHDISSHLISSLSHRTIDFRKVFARCLSCYHNIIVGFSFRLHDVRQLHVGLSFSCC